MNKTEELHKLSKGTYEVCKKIGGLVLLLDLFPGLYVFGYVVFSGIEKRINPLYILLAAFLALIFKLRKEYYRQKGDSMRRISAHDYAFGIDTSGALLSTFKIEAPPLSEYYSKRLPTTNLQEYYEPSNPTGYKRYREIYAHSAFFTWHLQKYYLYLLFFIFVCLVAASINIFFNISVEEIARERRTLIASVVCSILIILFIFRCAEAIVNCFSSVQVAKNVSEKLMENRLSESEIDSIIMEYEFERASGDNVPTWMYRFCRDELKAAWDIRKTEIR